MSTWLITGGSGFIGRHLVAALLRDHPGARIRVLDDLSASSREDLAAICDVEDVPALPGEPPGAAAVQLVVGDVRDRRAVRASMAGIDHVVHLAASTGVQPSLTDPLHTTSVNVSGTVNVLDASRLAGCSSFVFASSSAVYPDREGALSEDCPPAPVSPYGASKASAELHCKAFHRSFGLPVVCLRFANVYGGDVARAGGVVAAFARAALAQGTLTVHGDGEQTRDFVHVDDVVRAVLRACSTGGVAGQVINIASGSGTSIRRLAETVAAAASECLGHEPSIAHGPGLSAEIRHQRLDVRRAARVLGWRPTVDLRRAIPRLLRASRP